MLKNSVVKNRNEVKEDQQEIDMKIVLYTCSMFYMNS